VSRKHAKLSPSDADRWMQCPGSINLTASLGERVSSIYSAEGTWAHQIREDCLELGLDAEDFVGAKMLVDGYGFTWRHEDAIHLQKGIDRIREFGGEMFIEKRVNLKHWTADVFGTLDCGIIPENRDNSAVISDLKWGQGVPVSAIDNRQQKIYALGFWDNILLRDKKIKKFTIIIDQPRAKAKLNRSSVEDDIIDLDAEDEDDDEEPTAPNEWNISLDELLDFGEQVAEAAEATKDPDAPRIPGEKQCRWCPAARIEGMCPEYEKFHFDALGITILNLDEATDLGIPLTMPLTITPARRTTLIRSWPMIKRWYERMHAHALQAALEGDFAQVPGLKAVEGRHGNRKFRDPEEAENALLLGEYIDPEHGEVFEWTPLKPSQIFTKKLISPAQAEKLLGSGKIPSLMIERGKPKPVLVEATDPKKAITPNQIEYVNLEDDEDVDYD
jgi:hypothetical protein